MSRDKVINYYVVACLIVLIGVAYMCFTQPISTPKPETQAQLYENVPSVIPGPPPQPRRAEHGEALAYMTIPRFGKDWLWVVSEGVTLDILNNGPGHYPSTALPGEVGNTAYAAHRSTHGDPFIDFDLLLPGDTVTLAQSGAEWTYEITTRPKIINPNESWILKKYSKNEKTLTLTTCWPKYGSEKRMYIRAKLIETK